MHEYFCAMPLGIPQNRDEYSLRIVHFLNYPTQKAKHEIVSKLDRAFLLILAILDNYELVGDKLEEYVSKLPVNIAIDVTKEKLIEDLTCFVGVKWQIRSNLAQVEMEYYDKREDELILRLLEATLQYLKCPIINKRIIEAQVESINSKDPIKRKKSKRFIEGVVKAIKGNQKAKPTSTGYWYSYYMFYQLVDTITKLLDESVEQQSMANYKDVVRKTFNISKSCWRLIEAREGTPQSIAYQVLIDAKMINSLEHYKTGIKKSIGELRKYTPLRTDFSNTLFILLDFIAQNPNIFAALDPFQYLSDSQTLKFRREEIQSFKSI